MGNDNVEEDPRPFGSIFNIKRAQIKSITREIERETKSGFLGWDFVGWNDSYFSKRRKSVMHIARDIQCAKIKA